MSAFRVDAAETGKKSSLEARSWHRGPSVGYPGHGQLGSRNELAQKELGAIAHLPHKNRPCCAPSGPRRALFFTAGLSGGAT